MEFKRILVTGCAGFIGSHFLERTLELGFDVIGVDNFSFASNPRFIHETQQKYPFKFKFLETDINNTSLIKKNVQFNKIDVIVNFAAQSAVDRSIETDGSEFVHSNVLGVNSLLNVCAFCDIPLVQVSTDETYGDAKGNNSYFETAALNPKNRYSATKAAADHLVLASNNTFGTKYLIVRPSNNFGERQHHEKLIPRALKVISEGKKIPIYGDGKQVRDWLYVKDNVDLILGAMKYAPLNNIYNLSCDNEMTNIELIQKILAIKKLKFEDWVEFVPDRLGHDFRYSINSAKVRGLFESKFNEKILRMRDNFHKNLKTTVKYYEEKYDNTRT